MYDPNEPGVDEARLDCLADKIRDNLGILNTALMRGNLWAVEYAVKASGVKIGDIQDMKVLPETEAILICVHAAEDDSDIKRETGENTFTNGMVRNFSTYISVYLNDKAFNKTDFIENRERILSRISDFMTDGLFNKFENAGIEMASHLYSGPGVPDKLKGYIVSVQKEWYGKSYGATSVVRGSRMLHAGYVG